MMDRKKIVCTLLMTALALLVFPDFLPVPHVTAANAQAAPQGTSGELESLRSYTPEELKAALATLSDESASELLLAALNQLAVNATEAAPDAAAPTGIAGVMKHLETVYTMTPSRLKAVIAGSAALPSELGRVFDRMTGGKGGGRLIFLLAGIAAILIVSYGVEKILRRTVFNFGDTVAIPKMGGLEKFGAALLAILPALLGIMAYTLISALLFLALFGAEGPIRHLYGPILTAIVIGRLAMLFMAIICAPRQKELRLLPMEDSNAQYLYSALTKILWVLVVGLILSKWFQRIGIPQDSFLLVNIAVGTFFMLWLAGLVWKNRTRVASYIQGDSGADAESKGWLTTQFAAIWHIVALAYLFWVWFACASRIILYGPNFGGALLRSLLVVPLFILLDRLMQAVLPAILGPGGDAEEKGTKSPDADSHDEPVPVKTLRSKLSVIRSVIRAVIFLVLLVWFLKAFNIELPFIEKIAAGGFNILVTIVLALVGWRWLNVFITRKLAETAPDPAEEKDEDDEFGGVVLDRSHTLLPMLRKFLGTVLFVMVIMIVLSSLGVDIGPLLAGAGVIGLAIGFGAQKLVSDVLSGFFFLMDDAFRVGEYIKAGSVSGTVEATTLRNAMIRHHLGTLQIVPYSDMGTINNSMRGGLVIKINIDLPYDTDIETVRKVVKKVGKNMLNNPDYGADFIQPVKSQGVSKVGDSVMTFRVKFTAKPGTQFVIKREAFRQIKDALEKKGIYLAHRKVIVEVPETPKENAADREQAIRAGAAAALDTMANQNQEDGQEKT
jgi:small-conductance mechanosensitive channel